jgi:hypothetical protein
MAKKKARPGKTEQEVNQLLDDLGRTDRADHDDGPLAHTSTIAL